MELFCSKKCPTKLEDNHIFIMEQDFTAVYHGNKRLVWSLAAKYANSREDREDLFQEVFLNVHKALPRFRGDSSASTWIYRIAVNTAINFSKKQNRYKWTKAALSAFRIIEEMPVAENNRDVDIEALKPLEKLNHKQKMIFLLAEVEEKKLEEIADIMKIPVGTVKSSLHRAREIIRKEVDNNE